MEHLLNSKPNRSETADNLLCPNYTTPNNARHDHTARSQSHPISNIADTNDQQQLNRRKTSIGRHAHGFWSQFFITLQHNLHLILLACSPATLATPSLPSAPASPSPSLLTSRQGEGPQGEQRVHLFCFILSVFSDSLLLLLLLSPISLERYTHTIDRAGFSPFSSFFASLYSFLWRRLAFWGNIQIGSTTGNGNWDSVLFFSFLFFYGSTSAPFVLSIIIWFLETEETRYR